MIIALEMEILTWKYRMIVHINPSTTGGLKKVNENNNKWVKKI